MASYNQRALCVRLLCSCLVKKKLPIKCVKFITSEDNKHIDLDYKWPDHEGFYSLDEFYQVIDSHLGTFEKHGLPTDYWSPLTYYIELSNYQYTQVDSVDSWITKPNMTRREMDEKLSQMTAGQRTYLSSFGAALKSDMAKGAGQAWLQVLILNMLQMGDDHLILFDVFWIAPSIDCSTNTEVETIRGDLKSQTIQNAYQEEFSSTPLPEPSTLNTALSESSSTESTDFYNMYNRQRMVPDFCVCLPDFPGVFPLVVEIKPAGKENSGFVQIKQQMLSKIFFQDVIFGLTVTPKVYRLSFIIKKGENLHFATTGVIRIQKLKNGVLSLDVEAVNNVCTFIYRVIKWAKKTKCLFQSAQNIRTNRR